MTPSDLAALHKRCFVTPKPWPAQAFESLLRTQGCFLLPAPGAFLLGRVVVDEAELLTLAVAPEARRGGTGRRLTDQFLATSAAQGATMAFLEVAADNAPALGLYRAAGFAPAGLRKGYYTRPDGAKIDAAVMTCALNAL